MKHRKPETLVFEPGDRVVLRIDSHPRPATVRRIIEHNQHPYRIVVDADAFPTPYTVRADQLEPLDDAPEGRLPYVPAAVYTDSFAAKSPYLNSCLGAGN